MEQVEHGVQVAADGIEEVRAVEFVGEDGEGAVGDGVIDGGRTLVELAVGIDVYGFIQPLADAAEVGVLFEEFVHLGKSFADDPTVR